VHNSIHWSFYVSYFHGWLICSLKDQNIRIRT